MLRSGRRLGTRPRRRADDAQGDRPERGAEKRFPAQDVCDARSLLRHGEEAPELRLAQVEVGEHDLLAASREREGEIGRRRRLALPGIGARDGDIRRPFLAFEDLREVGCEELVRVRESGIGHQRAGAGALGNSLNRRENGYSDRLFDVGLCPDPRIEELPKARDEQCDYEPDGATEDRVADQPRGGLNGAVRRLDDRPGSGVERLQDVQPLKLLVESGARLP